MWYIILCACVMIGIITWAVISTRDSYQRAETVAGVSLMTMLLGSIFTAATICPVIKTSGGWYDDYGEGEREGYLTAVRYEGYFFKTYECEIQTGTGELASLEKPWRFSAFKQLDGEHLQSLIGKKVRLKYKSWFMQPYSYGGTNHQYQSIEVIKNNLQRLENNVIDVIEDIIPNG